MIQKHISCCRALYVSSKQNRTWLYSHKGYDAKYVRIVFQSVQFSDSFEPIRKAFTLGRNENYEVGDTLEARAFNKTKNNECNKMYKPSLIFEWLQDGRRRKLIKPLLT